MYGLEVLYQASGVVLTWMTSGTKRVLATGVPGFRFHFAPQSGRVSVPGGGFGPVTTWQAICDYDISINPGDVLVLTYVKGQPLSQFGFYSVAGVNEYPSAYLPHKVAILNRYHQS